MNVIEDPIERRIERLERERDNAWDKYAEVCREVGDLEQECERLRALGKEITHDAQTLSQNNMDLRKRLAQAEKVVEAAKEGHIHKPVFEFGQQVRLHEDRSECPLCAALAEWEGKDVDQG